MAPLSANRVAPLAANQVAPLRRKWNGSIAVQINTNQAMKHLIPLIEYNSEQYLLITPQLTSMPKHLLKQPLGTVTCKGSIL